MKNKIVLDIALLTAGRVDLFSKCVDALLPQLKPAHKVTVHNNGHPSKEYEEIYKRLPEGTTIKRSNTMSSFAEGANLAIRAGNAPLVLFITDDVFLHDGAIDVLLKRMEDTTIGQCGLKLLFPETEGDSDPFRPSGKVQHIGMASTVRGEMIHPCIGWSATNPKCNIPQEVLAVTGATFMVRRTLFNRVGGFDPAYEGGYYEDMELSFAIRANGGKIFIDTDAVATHCVGATFGTAKVKPNIQKNKLLFQSRWLTQTPWDEWKMW